MLDAPSYAKLIAHVGPRLLHVTAAQNAGAIAAQGLWPAADLARRAGVDPASILLRSERLQIGAALLNHQRPLQRYLRAAGTWLDMPPEDWAAQLDERIFLWPERESAAFLSSVARTVPVHLLWLDTAALLDVAAHRMDLSALNSGSFRQIPAERRGTYDRGLWIYRPVTEGLDAFRRDRRARGLAKSLDRVREVSLRGGLDAATLARVTWRP
ncbi:MAG: hypothetical protein AAF218_07415 [Pseudomonadota bacterium]